MEKKKLITKQKKQYERTTEPTNPSNCLALTVVEYDLAGLITLLYKRRLETVTILLHLDMLEQG